MLITLDTNVLVQALSSNKGASYKILEALLKQELKLALSVSVFQEYEDVLSREKLQKKWGFDNQDTRIILNALLKLGKRQKIFYLWRPNLKDEKDNLFVELAIASQSQYLVTNNIKDFVRGDLVTTSYQLVTPGEFYRIWEAKK